MGYRCSGVGGERMTKTEKQLAIKAYCDKRPTCTAYDSSVAGHVKECPLLQVRHCTRGDCVDLKYKLLEEFLKTEQATAEAAVLKNASEAMKKLGEALQPVHKLPETTANPPMPPVKPPKNMVHHPAHYCYSEYEPKDVIRAWGLNFNLGSAVKYIARAGRKDDILQELNKAKQFIEFEIEAIEKERRVK